MSPAKPSRPGKGDAGFTFVEILIALAVGAIVIVGMYQAFNTLHKWWISTGIRSDMRQNARAGMELITRDIEMAGYQTTPYGDVNKTGLPITLASTHEIEMDQQRPDSATIGSATPVYEPRLVYYHLATDMRTGRQNLYRQIRTQPGLPTPDEIVAENISVFTLGYFDEDNKKFKDPGDPASPADLPNPPYLPGTLYSAIGTVPAQYSFGSAPPDVLKSIRRVQVTLTTIPVRAVPIGPAPKPYTLTASVTPQNLAAADEVTLDRTPPSVPKGLIVIDNRSCSNKLTVKWNHNPQQDEVQGYIIYYGPTDYLRVPTIKVASMTTPEATLDSPKVLITKYADRTAAPNTYIIQILAYDAAELRSPKSATVRANPPHGDHTTISTTTLDTTVNPMKPRPPAGLTVSVTGEELALSWPEAGMGTVGYRLYRSTAPFVENAHIDGSLQIAGEMTLKEDEKNADNSVRKWPDKPEVCSNNAFNTYYYAVATVNCDETLFDDLTAAGYRYNSSAALSDYAVASGTPQDTTPPPAPKITEPNPEDWQAAQKRILTLRNPLEAEPQSTDFDRTEIWWSKVSYPILSGATVTGGTLLPKRESPSSSAGIFRNRGSQAIVIDRETLPEVTPSIPLEAGRTYYILAVSYDRCGNPSPAVKLALLIPTTAVPCAAIPLVFPSNYFTGVTYSSCQPGAVEIGWEYPDRASVAGFAGFRIARFLGGTKDADLTAGPTSLTSWSDAASLQVGGEYHYEVRATDCLYEQNPTLNSLHASNPVRIPPGSGTISPGKLRRFPPSTASGHEYDSANFVTSVSDVIPPRPFSFHNNVKFFLQNTSGRPLTIRKMAVSWGNPDLVLDSVVIGTPPAIPAHGAASGEVFSVGAEIEEASDVGSPSPAVPVLLRFTTPAGAVNRLVDLRRESLNVSLWVGDQSAGDAQCPTPTKITIDVPRGPEIGFFSQSAPGRDGIDSYAAPGSSGTARDTDIKVSTGVGVNVYGIALDHSRDLLPPGVSGGFDSAPAVLKLVGAHAAAAGSTAVPTMLMSDTFDQQLYSLGCNRSIGGDRYAISQTTPAVCGALMPQEPNMVHWYFALAVDKTGNWDRLPNPDHGNYAYFQRAVSQEFPDVCLRTPEKPGALSGAIEPSSTGTGKDVVLTWTAATKYKDPDNLFASDDLNPDDILRYNVYYNKGGQGWILVPDEASSSTGYIHNRLSDGTTPLPAGTYYYRVQARNTCSSCTTSSPCTSSAPCTSCMTGQCLSECIESGEVVIP